MSDVWTIELEKEEPAITAELAQQSGESYTLPMAGPDVLGGVKPAQKTNEMTKRVGIDENGRLWSEKESEQMIEEVIGKYLQNNPITSEETDPTVPEWAKQPNKPTYTAAEVGALPANTVIPDGGIPIPNTASVGQTVVVKAVDENGKPTEWEAADLPSRGSAYEKLTTFTVAEDSNALHITECDDGTPIFNQNCTDLLVKFEIAANANATSYQTVFFNICNTDGVQTSGQPVYGYGQLQQTLYTTARTAYAWCELTGTETAKYLINYSTNHYRNDKRAYTAATPVATKYITGLRVWQNDYVIPAGSVITIWGR